MGLKQWLGYETDVLVSPLPIEECIERLRSAAESEWAIFGSASVVGKVSEKSLRLRKRLKLARNSFQTHLFAKLARDGMSTRLTCRFGPHPFVIGFLAVWFGGVIAGALGGLAFGLRQSTAGTVPSAGLLVPWGMVGFGIVLVVAGRWMARGERQFLLDFLAETIDAQPLVTSVPVASVVQR